MSTNRMEAFSDGVLAIIITIMVLELKAPKEATFEALRPLLPVLLSYALSFVFVGLYWNNHHHLLQAVKQVDGRVLWANLHLLFWLSLVPFTTAWMGENYVAPTAVALYGAVLLLASVAYYILARLLVAVQGEDTTLADALGADFKGKFSIVLYAVAILLACFVSSWAAIAIYIGVALMWFMPDRRIEEKVK